MEIGQLLQQQLLTWHLLLQQLQQCCCSYSSFTQQLQVAGITAANTIVIVAVAIAANRNVHWQQLLQLPNV